MLFLSGWALGMDWRVEEMGVQEEEAGSDMRDGTGYRMGVDPGADPESGVRIMTRIQGMDGALRRMRSWVRAVWLAGKIRDVK